MSDETQSALIEQDHECVHCGYNLRGLDREGKCPECFTPVARSLHGNLLRFADPDWLEKVRFGTVLKLWTLLVTLLLAVAAGVVIAAGLPMVLLVVVAMVSGGLGLWASLAITTQEPRISMQEDPITWRRVIRFCAVVNLVAATMEQAGAAGTIPKPLEVVGKLLGLLGLLAIFGELLYFRRFAQRIPDDRLARSTKIVMWGTVICMGFLIAGASALPLLGAGAVGGGGAAVAAGGGTGGPQLGAWFVALGGIICVAAIPGLVFFIWYVVLLFRYKDVFTKIVAEARGIAMGETPPPWAD